MAFIKTHLAHCTVPTIIRTRHFHYSFDINQMLTVILFSSDRKIPYGRNLTIINNTLQNTNTNYFVQPAGNTQKQYLEML